MRPVERSIPEIQSQARERYLDATANLAAADEAIEAAKVHADTTNAEHTRLAAIKRRARSEYRYARERSLALGLTTFPRRYRAALCSEWSATFSEAYKAFLRSHKQPSGAHVRFLFAQLTSANRENLVAEAEQLDRSYDEGDE